MKNFPRFYYILLITVLSRGKYTENQQEIQA